MRTYIIGGLAAVALVGCEKKIPEGADLPPQPAPTHAAGSQPASRPASGPAHGAANPHGGMGATHGQPGAQAAPSGAPVSGVIKLGEGGAVGASDVLFVMARKDSATGPLVAVKRIPGLSADKFPLRFELGASDVMMQGIPFAGPFHVYARLDKDGDPMTKTPADLYADASAPVDNGAKDLELALTKQAAK